MNLITFPRLGEGEIPEPARMAEEIGFVLFAGQRRGVIGFGGSDHAAESSASNGAL